MASHSPILFSSAKMQMIAELCQDDAQKWKDVEDVSIQALEKRIELWDAIEEKIEATLELA